MAIAGIGGLAVGSFLNLCADRLPRNQSIVRPRSYCESCGRHIENRHLIPVISYLWLRGRCGYCSAHIPLRSPVVELATGLSFAFLYWNYGYTVELGIALVYASLLILVSAIDVGTQLILDRVVYPGMALALIFSLAWPGLGPARAGLGGAIGLAALLMPFLLYRRGMGLGDVKFGGLVGLMTGYPLVFVALFLAVTTGGVVAVLLLVLRVRGRRDPVPFGPFLALAAAVTLLWGDTLWAWYTSWLSGGP
ncbi:MAG: prepilin peptidase [Chloroflexota bacterium]|nr:prepilin peptidase [Chloroflexota bacterium]